MTRVLYVDDEEDIREVAVMALELGDLDVTACASGAEAIAACKAAPPDLVLLDVMMPGMDGPTVLAALRADPATQGIPVVFITARTQAEETRAFVEMGALGVIAKPFDPMTLADIAREYLGQ